MTLGTFHFSFPNLDQVKIEKGDQIDVLDPVHQKEIEGLVDRLAEFHPTILVIERQPSRQAEIDALYRSYLGGKHILGRSEEQQIGFRLAKRLRLERLHCVDEWGQFAENVRTLVEAEGGPEAARFEKYFIENPDIGKKFVRQPIFKTQGIIAELRRMNDPESIRKSMGNYLIGVFKYEEKPNDFIGVDFETGRWFNRNLRILRNIQRIATKPGDRILVIIGADHLNLLNYFFECSPEYELISPLPYIK
ncbi:MAG: hypothetical protein JW843_07930 [Candidatus Aminicenantes bacterium]|nr:hypothetical protein [Candidatus Aminicenantes bacterium]